MMEIDYKKMLEQDPEFSAFAKDVTLGVITQTQQDFIGMLYGFFQADMEIDQAINTIKMIMLFGDKGDKHDPR